MTAKPAESKVGMELGVADIICHLKGMIAGDFWEEKHRIVQCKRAIRILQAVQASGLSEVEIMARLHPVPDAPERRCEKCCHWQLNLSMSNDQFNVFGDCEVTRRLEKQDFGCVEWEHRKGGVGDG